jgi:hypothetical protein
MNVTIQLPARGPGLPQSIPYRKDTPVNIIIQRDQNDPPGPVQFDIAGCSVVNGVASMASANELPASGQIIIHGERQTTPGNSGLIQVRAQFNGQEFLSDGFSVCAHPAAIVNGPDCAPHVYLKATVDPVVHGQDAAREYLVGLFVSLRVVSDSGVDSDLDHVQDQELVSEPREHSASMQGNPQGHPNIAISQRATEARLDRHDSALDDIVRYAGALNGRTGWWANDQLDTFVCERCHMTEPAVVPNSGYRIVRSIRRSADSRIRFRISKDAARCTVTDATSNIDYESEPGPSPRNEAELDLERVELDLDYAAMAGLGAQH